MRTRTVRREKAPAHLRVRARWMLSVVAVCCLCGLGAVVAARADTALLSFGLPMLAPLLRENAVQAADATLPAAQDVRRASMELTAQTEGKENRAGADEPRVLIYHTHATEAYTKTEAMQYKSSGSWRTEDPERSVVSLGRRLQQELQTVYGITAVHDTTNHEPPKLATSYSRSEETMRAYRDKYPSIELFIDVHRDAYGTGSGGVRDYVTYDGTELARIMFVVGTGKGATGTGFPEMPDFESNLALAEQITAYLRQIDERLARDVRVKSGRYNQHISDHCLLVEIGHNANTLEQATASVPYLAAGIAEAMEGLTLETSGAAPLDAWSPAVFQ